MDYIVGFLSHFKASPSFVYIWPVMSKWQHLTGLMYKTAFKFVFHSENSNRV
ncbi:Uncharacterized protein APZ42_013294 [Daphnia magna]|uniref:Uncharacterized protein n=1 Tax=Daphnia magna TaxID=35525 RepID=A0A162R0E8_9CRUS|nr:Uncharacterized protein APZ42_013294 [Daphnia magna]